MSEEKLDGNPDEAYSRRLAGHIVDALSTAGVLEKANFDRAVEITAEEILVRRLMNDR